MAIHYRREIDGLRALAILPVVFFHAGYRVISGGFVGVDVFFVISGYLITGIIATELDAGRYSSLNFYERRARRILPSLTVMLFCCLPFAWHLLPPEGFKNFGESLISVSLFISNFFFYTTSSYFDSESELKPLLHTWSLAIEEQFYLAFPLLLVVLWRFSRRIAVIALWLIAVASFALAQYGTFAFPSNAFYLLPTRSWELLVGGLLSLHMTETEWEPSHRTRQIFSALGLAVLIGTVFVYNPNLPFPGAYALVPTFAAASLLYFTNNETWVGKLLSNKWIAGIGLASYSSYLWHQPILAFARLSSVGGRGLPLVFVMSLASLLVGHFSFKYVEAPFRNKNLVSSRMIFSLSAVAILCFFALGLVIVSAGGFPSRSASYVAAAAEIDLPRTDNGWCFYSVDSEQELEIGDKGLSCWLGDKLSPHKGILFGDSFAAQYDPLWALGAKRLGMGLNEVSTNWCFPSLDKKFTGPNYGRAFEQCLINRHYISENIGKYELAILGGAWGSILTQNKLDSVLDFVDFVSPKVKLVVIMASPKQFELNFGSNVGTSYKKSLWLGANFDISQFPSESDADYVAANQRLAEFSKRYPNVVFVDRSDMFQIDGRPSDVSKENIPFSWDGSHISIYGSKVAGASFVSSAKFRLIEDRLTQ